MVLYCRFTHLRTTWWSKTRCWNTLDLGGKWNADMRRHCTSMYLVDVRKSLLTHLKWDFYHCLSCFYSTAESPYVYNCIYIYYRYMCIYTHIYIHTYTHTYIYIYVSHYQPQWRSCQHQSPGAKSRLDRVFEWPFQQHRFRLFQPW